MKSRIVSTCFAALIVGSALGHAQTLENRPEWSRFFEEGGARGTIVVVDERVHKSYVYNEARARMPLLPASTFKIPHALFALEAGIVKDEFQVFKWDGTKREIEMWNQDHGLRGSMRHSVVPIYQLFARELGEARERAFLKQVSYGNADISGGLETFWLNGGLRISPIEQISFLQKLFRNQLPFKLEHQRLVKDIIVVEAGKDIIVRAKTGWAARSAEPHGWWVGWVERPNGAIFFALNIEMPGGGEDAPKREAIARAVLRSIEALPPG
jgi:beta-lactamase class D